MRKFLLISILFIPFFSCNNENSEDMVEIENKAVFLHHSTGNNIWKGGTSKYKYKIFKSGDVQKWIKNYNKQNNTNYLVKEQPFPQREPYGWKNYPYDYYNIWVKNGGEAPFMEEPTLEMLTKEYGLIIWKHCYPVSNIGKDTGTPNIDSQERRLENYKLQYDALKKKMHEFPKTKFLVWTGATHVKANTEEEKAMRMQKFVDWVKNDWNEEGDNIFIWDFYGLETEGGLYLKEEYAESPTNSHPNKAFSKKTSGVFAQKIVDVFKTNLE